MDNITEVSSYWLFLGPSKSRSFLSPLGQGSLWSVNRLLGSAFQPHLTASPHLPLKCLKSAHYLPYLHLRTLSLMPDSSFAPWTWQNSAELSAHPPNYPLWCRSVDNQRELFNVTNPYRCHTESCWILTIPRDQNCPHHCIAKETEIQRVEIPFQGHLQVIGGARIIKKWACFQSTFSIL